MKIPHKYFYFTIVVAPRPGLVACTCAWYKIPMFVLKPNDWERAENSFIVYHSFYCSAVLFEEKKRAFYVGIFYFITFRIKVTL